MTKIVLNDKEYNYPTSFDDITMKQYCRCFYKLKDTNKEMSDAEASLVVIENEAVIISRLLGEDDNFVSRLPLPVFRRLQEHSRFIYEIKEFMDSKSFFIKIDGKKYFMPSPEEMSLRQYIDADMIMKEDDNEGQFIELLSCLLLPYKDDGSFEYDGDYRRLVSKIENLRASDGLPFIYTYFKKKILSNRLSKDFLELQEEVSQRLRSIQSS